MTARTYATLTFLTLLLCIGSSLVRAEEARMNTPKICIAHGGASAYAPFSSMPSFRRALESSADYIETDLQLTKDGVLVCFHNLSLEDTTNVEELFPKRYAEVEGEDATRRVWYVNDFTLAEIKTLDAGAWFDPEFAGETIPTFQELIDLAKGKTGLYPETKDPDFYRARNLDIDAALHALLKKNRLDTREGQRHTPIIIQSFHESSLRRLRQLGGDQYTLIQLVWFGQWNDYMTDAGLAHVATYADGVGPFLSMVLPPNASRVHAAHRQGLAVHVWKAHEAFPPKSFSDLTSYCDYLLTEVGVDGIFTPSPEQWPKK